ncbi:DUF5388 domain-containing protein [Vagococcus luciliae]|uniref:Replication-associated protein RepC n=1 Tax=Vagococcus luciliae TaxID=2920380 RepID=A0ABY5P1X0_9ENTE|nr:DUF5388 domain-containing protein [Vagococcus luciliae]UUV99917.1 hypothetical protein G314FT_20860 [Vagococcus luciliae]
MTNRKKSNLLQPSSPATPNQTYTRENIYSVNENTQSEKLKKTMMDSKNSRGKRTSVSCFQDTKNSLQALITIMDTKNIDEVIENLIDSYTEVLSDEELNEFRLIRKSLDKRTIKR